MMTAWRLNASVSFRICAASSETTVFEGFTGSAHVLAELGSLIVEQCTATDQTIDQLASYASTIFEVDQPEELDAAVGDTVRKLHSLGILTPCPINSGNLTQTQSSDG